MNQRVTLVFFCLFVPMNMTMNNVSEEKFCQMCKEKNLNKMFCPSTAALPSVLFIKDAQIAISVSAIGTDSGVAYSTHTCKISADTTTLISVVRV